MKKYTNIPLKERKRNVDRVYRHEVRLEEINEKRAIKDKFGQYDMERDYRTDKEREFDEIFAQLKERFGEESEDTE